MKVLVLPKVSEATRSVVRLCCFCFLFGFPVIVLSQDNIGVKHDTISHDTISHDTLPKEILNAPNDLFKFPLDTLSLKERIYIRTNFVEWALLSPNVMVEFDILPYSWNKWTVAIGGRYNDFADNVMSPRNVFNVKTFRVETRRYWHTTYRDLKNPKVHRGREYDPKKWGFVRNVLSRQRNNPREERRAYYVGGFASVSDFSIKLGQRGKQGKAKTFGVTFGFQQPLYGYTSGHTIDLELGVSVGVASVDYDTYQYNSQFDCYPKIGPRKQEIVPALSELRLALVYRFGRSSRERYHERYGSDMKYSEHHDSVYFAKMVKMQRTKERRDSLMKARNESDSLDNLKKISPIRYAHHMYKKLQEEKGESQVDIDSTEFGRMLHEIYAEHKLLKEAQKVSPERYQQVKDSLDAMKDPKKAAELQKENERKRKAAEKVAKTEPIEPADSATAQPVEGNKPKNKKKKSKKGQKEEEVEATEVKQDSVIVTEPVVPDETPVDQTETPEVTPTEDLEEAPTETTTEDSEETPVEQSESSAESEEQQAESEKPAEDETTNTEEKGGESE